MSSLWPKTVVLFVGGPWHGELQSLAAEAWPAKIEVRSPSDSELRSYNQMSWIWIDEEGSLESRTVYISSSIRLEEVESLIRTVEPRALKRD